ncbi:hypothetical protein DFH06DRAFT_1344791 [Mycena polygramma]|nr:hypothetical protein DFH06DRAFT_1344791 [Mycena polygramma]
MSTPHAGIRGVATIAPSCMSAAYIAGANVQTQEACSFPAVPSARAQDKHNRNKPILSKRNSSWTDGRQSGRASKCRLSVPIASPTAHSDQFSRAALNLAAKLIPWRLKAGSSTPVRAYTEDFEDLQSALSRTHPDMKLLAYAALISPFLHAAAVPAYGHLIPSQASLTSLMGPLFALWTLPPNEPSTSPDGFALPSEIPRFNLPLKLGDRLGGGSRGTVYDLVGGYKGRSDVVAKRLTTAEANDRNINLYFRPEGYALDKINQFLGWGFQEETGAKYYYIVQA